MRLRKLTAKLEEWPYLVAFFVTATAVALQVGQLRLFGMIPTFIFFASAIAISAWWGGIGSSLFSTALVLMSASLLLIEPTVPFAEKTLSGRTELFFLAAESLLICALFHFFLVSRKQLEENLERSEIARDRAEESDRLKRNFISNMSHELRGPLSAVLGFTDLLSNTSLPESERETYRERLKLNAATLTHLVTDLLDVTEIDSAHFVANRKRLGLAEFMQCAYSTFARQAQDKSLKLQMQLRGSIPAYVESDPEQLMQILKQVVGNAIRYADQGLIRLTVTASKTLQGRREIAWIISDQGPGIASDVRTKIFKPLNPESPELSVEDGIAAAGTESKSHESTGMGLMLARKLARGLGGDVKLAKSSRRGTTFLITFDGGPADAAQELLDHLQLSVPSPQISQDDPHALDHTRALVVDDSPDSALLVGRMLKVAGAEVDTADRGQLGIEKALGGQFDVVLMDIQMPEMDGNEAIRRLRSMGFQKPIIALSAHAMKEDQEETRKSGADHYLTKPVSRRALLETVGRFSRITQSARPLEAIHLDLQPAT